MGPASMPRFQPAMPNGSRTSRLMLGANSQPIWRGADSMGPAYQQSHLKAVIDSSNMSEFVHDFLELTEKTGRELSRGQSLLKDLEQKPEIPSLFLARRVEFGPKRFAVDPVVTKHGSRVMELVRKRYPKSVTVGAAEVFEVELFPFLPRGLRRLVRVATSFDDVRN